MAFLDQSVSLQTCVMFKLIRLFAQELLKDVQAGKAESGRGVSMDVVHQQGEPFISGTFEYGLGRSAVGRKVYLFINKAQDHRQLHDAMVQFLGVYKTNRKVSMAPQTHCLMQSSCGFP